MSMTIEEIRKGLAEATKIVSDPNYKRPTVESLKLQLENGEIDQKEYKKIIMIFQLTPESVDERIRVTREKMYESRLRNRFSSQA